ncbi:MAG: BACON domain-containing protein [Bacteroides sp.]|nr:BACON domain-containing protein [Bacteroides sp.]
MKNRIIYTCVQVVTLLLLFSVTACQDEVSLPGQTITLSTNSIIAPSFASTFSFDVEANCDWNITMTGNEEKWAEVSVIEATGILSVSVSVDSNEGTEARTVTLSVTSNRNAAVKQELTLVQAAASAEGYLSIADIRTLASEGSYTITADKKMRAIVMSSILNNSYYTNRLALQGSTQANSGITLHTDNSLMLGVGEEIEVDLNGAVVSRDAETGLLELKPASDEKVVRTETNQITPKAVSITTDDLKSGQYESMYVSLACQVVTADLSAEKLSDNVTMQTESGERFVMAVLESATFADEAIPTGSGNLGGIAVPYEDNYAVMPCQESDIDLNAARFDGGGVVLPYVVSFMTTGANNSGKYALFTEDASDIRNSYLTATDGTGVVLTASLSNKDSKNIAFKYWNDNSGHHNLPMAAWLDGSDNYIQFALPLGENIEGGLRFSIGIGAQKNAPRNWQVQCSVDGENWFTPEGAPHFVIPAKKPIETGRYFFYHSVDVPYLPVSLEKRQTLYIRVSPYDGVSVNGGSISGGYGRAQFHSCAVLERIPKFSTARPADAVYFEAFDMLTEGLDYRLGDKLAAMLNYCGSNITEWSEKNGLEGTNVHQRPGYAQIGYVDSQYTKHTAYVNEVGELNTPALGATGTLNLSFKAMAYKNTSVYPASKAADTAKDIDGDLQSVVVEVVGGGTIDGATTKVVSGLSYTAFKSFSLTIENATAETSLRFTSAPADGEYSRWFIDEVCVTK